MVQKDKFQNKYRIASSRAAWRDYSANGAYFITICTHDRQHFFGEIHSGKMVLSAIGKMANHYWHEIPRHFPFVMLDAFVVMPNHVHGILIIDKPNMPNPNVDPRSNVVETRLIASLQQQRAGGVTGNNNPMLHDNLSRIIRWYKGRVSFELHKIQVDFAWQSRFHDHIIRNETSYQRIAKYIIDNPAKWQTDQFYAVQTQDFASQQNKDN